MHDREQSEGMEVRGLNTFRIDGIVPVVPTLFDANEEVDWTAFRSLLDFASGAEVDAVCSLLMPVTSTS